jgi:hypothetical protein
MEKRWIKVISSVVMLCMVIVLSACSGDSSSSQPQADGQMPNNAAGNSNEVMGMFSSATDDTLVIELVDMQGMMGGNRPEGAPDDSGMPNGDPPDGWEPGDGSMPEGFEPPDGASFPADGSFPQGGGQPGGFESTGETMEIKVTDNTTITVMGSDDKVSLDDLETGEVLRVTLDEDGATAVSIIVMRQTRGEQGA